MTFTPTHPAISHPTELVLDLARHLAARLKLKLKAWFKLRRAQVPSQLLLEPVTDVSKNGPPPVRYGWIYQG